MGKLTLKRELSASENKELREEFTNRLAARLRELRTKKGLTQQELSAAANLHLTYVGHLEAAKYHPTAFVVWKLAKALGVSMDELTDI